MAYLEWRSDQIHVRLPPKGARETLAQLELSDNPLLEALWPQAVGVKFEISGLVGILGVVGNCNPQFQTLTASLPVEEARDLALWILDNID